MDARVGAAIVEWLLEAEAGVPTFGEAWRLGLIHIFAALLTAAVIQ